MNIVYHQHGNFIFLKEGLEKLGHKVYPIQFRENEPFDTQIESVCSNADLVFFEMYGPFKLPSLIEESKICKVAYCIDSSVYEFFLIHTMKMFNYVFVDQRSTVNVLSDYGIKSAWLPLCVPESNFINNVEKIYDITFVGALSSDRFKRKNLISYIQKYFKINYQYGIDIHAMQQIFSQSRIVLNENHFNGVNLRVFQTLASGSLLLTEKDSDGLSLLFKDGRDLITYSRSNIIEKIDEYLKHNDKANEIAYHGYLECKTNHSSLARARQCMDIIEEGKIYNKTRHKDELLLEQAEAIYTRCIRFGGDYRICFGLIEKWISLNGDFIGKLYTLIGSIFYTNREYDKAISFFYKAFSQGDKINSLAKLIMIYINIKDFEKAKQLLLLLIGLSNNKCDYLIKFVNNEQNGFAEESRLYYSLSRILFEHKKIYHVGFFSNLGINRYLPETAVEIAYISWKIDYNPAVLDFIIRCYELKSIKIEAISLLKIAEEKGVLTSRQKKIYDKLQYETYMI